MDSLILIIAIIVILWIRTVYQNWVLKKQRIKLIKEAKSIIHKYYSKLVNDIKTRYPFIKFNLPSQDEINNKLDNASFFSFKDVDDFVKEALAPIAEKARNNFITHRKDFIVDTSIPLNIGSKNFWENEEHFRYTNNGHDPHDWEERRTIAYQRDKGKCIRCGRSISLDECNIHHLKRRSEGGDHSFENLVTLCLNCHQLMEGHEGMKAIRPYYVSNSGTLHTDKCYYSRNSKKIWGSVPRILEKGFTVCKKCDPWTSYYFALEYWKPEIEKYINDKFKEILNNNYSTSY